MGGSQSKDAKSALAEKRQQLSDRIKQMNKSLASYQKAISSNLSSRQKLFKSIQQQQNIIQQISVQICQLEKTLADERNSKDFIPKKETIPIDAISSSKNSSQRSRRDATTKDANLSSEKSNNSQGGGNSKIVQSPKQKETIDQHRQKQQSNSNFPQQITKLNQHQALSKPPQNSSIPPPPQDPHKDTKKSAHNQANTAQKVQKASNPHHQQPLQHTLSRAEDERQISEDNYQRELQKRATFHQQMLLSQIKHKTLHDLYMQRGFVWTIFERQFRMQYDQNYHFQSRFHRHQSRSAHGKIAYCESCAGCNHAIFYQTQPLISIHTGEICMIEILYYNAERKHILSIKIPAVFSQKQLQDILSERNKLINEVKQEVVAELLAQRLTKINDEKANYCRPQNISQTITSKNNQKRDSLPKHKEAHPNQAEPLNQSHIKTQENKVQESHPNQAEPLNQSHIKTQENKVQEAHPKQAEPLSQDHIKAQENNEQGEAVIEAPSSKIQQPSLQHPSPEVVVSKPLTKKQIKKAKKLEKKRARQNEKKNRAGKPSAQMIVDESAKEEQGQEIQRAQDQGEQNEVEEEISQGQQIQEAQDKPEFNQFQRTDRIQAYFLNQDQSCPQRKQYRQRQPQNPVDVGVTVSRYDESISVQRYEGQHITDRRQYADQNPRLSRNWRRENEDGYLRGGQEDDQDDQDDQYEQKVREAQQQVIDLILKYHKGNPQGRQFYLDPKIKISNFFYKEKKYTHNLLQLLKNQILEDVTKRLEDKQDEYDQKLVEVQCSRYNQGNNDSQKIIYNIKGTTRRYHIDLKECLIKGGRMGILTSINDKFQIQNFSRLSTLTFICFLGYETKRKEAQSRNMQVIGIPREDLPPIMYFIDLDAIISHVRQYAAITLAYKSPRINDLLRFASSKPVHHPTRKALLRSGVLGTIRQKRNNAQVQTIQKLSQNDQGIFLIQGPPGTGKTETIVNYISLEHQYAKKNLEKEKGASVVMVCAQSNAAINHIVRKIVKQGLLGSSYSVFGAGFKPRVLRLGSTEQYDQQILSVNLAHLCQIQLLKLSKSGITTSSARLRFEKLLKYEQINKLARCIIECNDQQLRKELKQEIQQLRDQLYEIKEQLVQISDLISDKWELFLDIEQQFLEACEIVMSTLNTSGKKRYAKFFRNKIFCLIVDEASQATEPSILVPFQTKTKKMILVGDHKQLPPTVMSRNGLKTKYGRSLFERLIENGVHPDMLTIQYRMVPQLRQFPSRTFYDDLLKDGKEHLVPQSLRMRSPSWFIDVVDGQEEIFKRSYQNKQEAMAVMLLIDRLIRMQEPGKQKLSIGVISPYKSQISCIESQIEKRQYGQAIQKRIKVSTVDAFQGQERDIMIVSCVRANSEGKIGFVYCEKRMNVSITRAKYALFVFGNRQTLLDYYKTTNYWEMYINDHQKKQTLISVASKDLASAKQAIRDILLPADK